jgi:hypothetical protein
MKDLITIFLVVGLSLVLLSNTHIVIQQANAKNNTSSLDPLNSNENIEKKLHSDIWSKNSRKH